MPSGSELMLVARIGKPHGLAGESTVEVHTDAPESRFRVGEQFVTSTTGGPTFVLRSVRLHQGRYLLGFEGVGDRADAEALRDIRLYVSSDSLTSDSTSEVGADPDEFYEEELLGMAVHLASGEVVGEVSGLHTRPAQDLLEVRLSAGHTALIPFVSALVPDVDRSKKVVVIDPPAGLLEVGS